MGVRCTIVKPFEGARRPVSAREQRQVASDAGLSKKRVVAEAFRLADREGVDGLSMRRLAVALGAGAMSLYHYVASKGPTGSRRCDGGRYPPGRFSRATRGRSA
jgi:hypothetical protein